MVFNKYNWSLPAYPHAGWVGRIRLAFGLGVLILAGNQAFGAATLPAGVTLAQGAPNMGLVQVGASSGATTTFEFSFSSTSPAVSDVQVRGAQSGTTAEFIRTGFTNVSGSQTTLSVTVEFNPAVPGLRAGSLVFLGSGDSLLGIQPIYGTGVGPLDGFAPATIFIDKQAPWTDTRGNPVIPTQLALDAGGNLYMGSANGDIFYFPANYPGSAMVEIATPAFANPSSVAGVAVDAAGDLFYSDSANNRVMVFPNGTALPPTSGTPTQVSILPSDGASPVTGGMANPQGLATDKNGNLFVVDEVIDASLGENMVEIIQAAPTFSAGNWGDSNAQLFPFPLPAGPANSIAVDATGNIYFTNSSQIIGFNPATSEAFFWTAGNVDLTGAQSVALDPNGNLYIQLIPTGASATTGGQILAMTAPGLAAIWSSPGVITSPATEVPLSGLLPYSPLHDASTIGGSSIAADGSGNLFVADTVNARLLKIQASELPIFTFAATKLGQITSDSPQIMTLTNLGTGDPANPSHGDLTIGTVTPFPAVFTLVSGGPGQQISAGATIVPGASASLGIQCVPYSAGLFAGTTGFLDDSLSLSTGTQHLIRTQGVGLQTTPQLAATVTSTPPAEAAVKSASLLARAAVSPAVPAVQAQAQSQTIVTGETAFLQVTVTGPPAAIPPTGTVDVYSNNTLLSSSTPLVDGTGTVPVSTLLPGSYVFNASYPGDFNFFGVAFDPNQVLLDLTVLPRPTTTTLTLSGPDPIPTERPVTFTAQVQVQLFPGTATGKVEFLEVGKLHTWVFRRVPLNAQGEAIFTTDDLRPGRHHIEARYDGDTLDGGSLSNLVLEIVKPDGRHYPPDRWDFSAEQW
jgi:sugar lactone lactonase YvrE